MNFDFGDEFLSGSIFLESILGDYFGGHDSFVIEVGDFVALSESSLSEEFTSHIFFEMYFTIYFGYFFFYDFIFSLLLILIHWCILKVIISHLCGMMEINFCYFNLNISKRKFSDRKKKNNNNFSRYDIFLK